LRGLRGLSLRVLLRFLLGFSWFCVLSEGFCYEFLVFVVALPTIYIVSRPGGEYNPFLRKNFDRRRGGGVGRAEAGPGDVAPGLPGRPPGDVLRGRRRGGRRRGPTAGKRAIDAARGFGMPGEASTSEHGSNPFYHTRPHSPHHLPSPHRS